SGWSRVSVHDHPEGVLVAVTAKPGREQPLQQNAALRQENAQLRDWLFLTIEFPPGQATGVRRGSPRHGLEPPPAPRPPGYSRAPERLPVARPCIGGSRPSP